MGQDHPEKNTLDKKQAFKEKNRHKETLDQTKITARTYQFYSVNIQEIGLERLEGIGCK